MLPRILTRVVDWLRAHPQFGVEIENHGSSTWVFRFHKEVEIAGVCQGDSRRYWSILRQSEHEVDGSGQKF